MELLSEAYEALISEHGQKRPAKIGFVYLPPTGLDSGEEGDKATGGKQLVVVGSGSGFVIAPHIIATNHHVIEGAEQLMMLDPKDTTKHLAAELIAADEEIDVALIKCPKLDAPPLVMCQKLPPRGSDIMVLGYPLGPSFGANLKSTRGSMVAMPDAANDHLCLYDALTNPGNSGGPCVDSEGRVVAVVRANPGNIGGTYGAAIPMERAMPFFKKHVPDLESVSTAPKKLEWTAVDVADAPSTVLILQKQSTQSGLGR
jgi:S1-C subfamily serine protease